MPRSQNDIETHAQKHIRFLLQNSLVYAHFFDSISLVAVSTETTCRVVCGLKIDFKHLNSKHTLHGSVITTLADFTGGLAIACYDLRGDTGVITDMDICFLEAVQKGKHVSIQGRADKIGRSLAFTMIELRKLPEDYVNINEAEHSGTIVATGSHTKFIRQRQLQ